MEVVTDTPSAHTNLTSLPIQSSDSDEVAYDTLDISEIIACYRSQLLRFIQRHIRNKEDAEDLLQSSLLEAFRNSSSFRGQAKPKTWLFGIAVNMIRNHINRAPSCRFRFSDVTLIEDESVDSNDPESIVSTRNSSRKIVEYVSTLPVDIQEMLTLVCLEEMTYCQIAERLHLPVGTVKSRISRARLAIKKQIEA